MGRYVVRRLLQMIPVFFGVTFVMYFLMFALGNPLQNLSAGKQKNPAYEAYLTEQFHLERPLHRPVPQVHRRGPHRRLRDRPSPASRSRRSSSSGSR